MYFVVIAEHPPNLCPHSNSIVRKRFEEREAGGQGYEMAKKLNVERVFAEFPYQRIRPSWSSRRPVLKLCGAYGANGPCPDRRGYHSPGGNL